MPKKLQPIHTGDFICTEVMEPLGLSGNGLAKALGIPSSRVLEILNGNRSITADTAIRLGRYLERSDTFWMSLQVKYDLEVARDAVGGKIETSVVPRSLALASASTGSGDGKRISPKRKTVNAKERGSAA